MTKIIIAITGGSGSLYAQLLLEKLGLLSSQIDQVAVVFTDNAKTVWTTELSHSDISKIPFKRFDNKDFLAPFASGSAQFGTMIIVPCSMGTMGRIAGGISNDLITRAADVMLKERRKLILVLRETPYSLVHIKNMEAITLAGGIICPASPSFYSLPKTIEALASTVVDRVLDLAGLKQDSYRWQS